MSSDPGPKTGHKNPRLLHPEQPARGDYCRVERGGGLVRCCAGCGDDGRGLWLRLWGGAQAGENRGAPRDVGASG